jgi:hypothetical protein
MKLAALAPLCLLGLAACSDADVASHNLSKAADQFEINRRIVFYNGITGGYILTVEGLCSLGNNDKAGTLTVTCKTGSGQYKKQIESMPANVYRYRVIFKPSVIVPDVDVR